MGPQPTRITREDLLTPPEFANLQSADHPAARIGGARIELIRERDETRLGSSYQQVPVRFMPPFVLDDEAASLLYLINLTAGLMDGDGHLIEVVARAGTRSVVTGQSATRLHPAVKSHCSQQWTVDVEEGACLVVLPGPTIPFRGCRYYQRGRVRLAPNARLLWGDLWLAGRYERAALSERFEFERIVQDFEVRRGDRLVYRDRFRWDGPWSRDDAEWYFGGGLASGSLFIGGPLPDSLSAVEPGVKRAVLELDTGAACVRWCGDPAAVTRDLVRTTMSVAGCWTAGPGGRPWLLSSSSLAPNHWFSTSP